MNKTIYILSIATVLLLLFNLISVNNNVDSCEICKKTKMANLVFDSGQVIPYIFPDESNSEKLEVRKK